MNRLLQILLAIILCGITVSAQNDSTQSISAPRISLITCHAGSVMYELCGHTAIRVQHNENDWAVNYGLFEFKSKNFALKFLKGEPMYAQYPRAAYAQVRLHPRRCHHRERSALRHGRDRHKVFGGHQSGGDRVRGRYFPQASRA